MWLRFVVNINQTCTRLLITVCSSGKMDEDDENLVGKLSILS